jgi:hypothetical protein
MLSDPSANRSHLTQIMVLTRRSNSSPSSSRRMHTHTATAFSRPTSSCECNSNIHLLQPAFPTMVSDHFGLRNTSHPASLLLLPSWSPLRLRPRDQIGPEWKGRASACQILLAVRQSRLVAFFSYVYGADREHLAKPNRPKRAQMESTNISEYLSSKCKVFGTHPRFCAVVAARRITAGEDAAKKIDDLDLLDGSVRSCPHKGRGPCSGQGFRTPL